MEPTFEGDPARTELVADSDFALSKAGTDVLLAGRAVAPGGRPATRVGVRLKVADVDKALQVVGERLVYQGALGTAMTEPLPFLDMPLTWARGFGGYDPVDPGNGARKTRPGAAMRRGRTACARCPRPTSNTPMRRFAAPISGARRALARWAHHWLPRRRFGGTYDEAGPRRATRCCLPTSTGAISDPPPWTSRPPSPCRAMRRCGWAA